MCRTRFRKLIGVSEWKLKRWTSDIRQGHLQPSEDGRSAMTRKARATPKRDHVNAWLRWVYETMAESLAEVLQSEECRENRNAATKDPFEQLDEAEFLLLNPAVEMPVEMPVRYLPPGRLAELCDLYEHMTTGDSACASRAMFCQTFKEEWNHVLKFRAAGQHARCTICAAWTKIRSEAKTEQEREAAMDRHLAHFRLIFSDRSHDSRMQRMGRESTRPCTETHPDKSLLVITLDGMDQASLMPHDFVTQCGLFLLCVVSHCYLFLGPHSHDPVSWATFT